MVLSDEEKAASPFESHPILSKLSLVERIALQAELTVALRNVNAQGHIAGIGACSELCAEIAANQQINLPEVERRALLALVPTFYEFAIDFLKQNKLFSNAGLYINDDDQDQQ